MELIGAVDQGTTSTRFFLYNKQQEVMASHQMEFEQIHPQAGWVEHDPLTILHTVRECMKVAVAKAEENATSNGTVLRVRAVGLTNQRETTVVWRKSTGVPLYNAIVWMDTRTHAICEQLERDLPGGRNAWRDITGLPISTYFSALKLRWLLTHVPAVSEAVAAGDALFGTVDSWLLWNMTVQSLRHSKQAGRPCLPPAPPGGASLPLSAAHVTDCTNASRTLLMDLRRLQWHQGILQALGIPASILPRIIGNAEVVGPIAAGWPLSGVPLAGCLGDQHAAVLGQRCATGEAKATYGTGCFILMPTGSQPCASSHGLLTTVAHCLAPTALLAATAAAGGEGHTAGDGEEAEGRGPPPGAAVYALEGSIAIAGAAVQWLRDSLGVIRSAAEVQQLAESVESTGGLYFVPAFSGLFAPRWREDARGALLGISRYTTKAHVARAVLEAMAFQAKEVVDAMQEDAASVADAGGAAASQASFVLRADGGAAVNDLLLQIQADVLGCKVVRPKSTETTALGAAYAAGVAVGFWSKEDIVSAGDERDEWGKVFQPHSTEKDRDARYKSWCRAVEKSYDLAHLS